MKLQTKVGLGILVVFSILAVSLSVASVAWVNQNTIREAEQRVKLYIQSSWEIYNDKLARMQSTVEILAQEQPVPALKTRTIQRSSRPFRPTWKSVANSRAWTL